MNTGICIYCGKRRNLTPDHIPPKCIFPKPRPNNLITVPSCECCNNGASKDDEYFRVFLTMRFETYEFSPARENWPTVLRSLRRENAKGFKKRIMDNIEEVELFTKGGIYLGRSGKIKIEILRIEKVLNRIIYGIFYKETDRRISEEYWIRYLFLEDISKLDQGTKTVLSNVIPHINKQAPKVIGKDVFEYKFRCFDDDPNSFGAILNFFKFVTCLVICGPCKN